MGSNFSKSRLILIKQQNVNESVTACAIDNFSIIAGTSQGRIFVYDMTEKQNSNLSNFIHLDLNYSKTSTCFKRFNFTLKIF